MAAPSSSFADTLAPGGVDLPPVAGALSSLNAMAATPSLSTWWTVGLSVAGLASAAAVAYAVYFDHKRRTDPAFRKKIRDAYKKETQRQKEQSTKRMAHFRKSLPALPSMAEREQFMMDHLSRGETHVRAGNEEQAAFHFYNAVRVVPNATQLLQLFQQSLPDSVFRMVILFIQTEAAQEASPTQDID